MTTTATTIETPTTVRSTGSRLALVGALIYFCEWIAIVAAGGIDVLFKPGTSPATVLSAYQGHSEAFAWASGWFGVVLLGRALFATSLARVVRDIGGPREGELAMFGVVAMTVGVVFETAAYAVVAGAAAVADHGGDAAAVSAFDSVGLALDQLLWGATGAAVLVLSIAMARTGRFQRVLCILGAVSGTALLVDGLAFNAPSHAGVANALQVAVPVLWAWMIWTSVVLWRRAPRSAAA